MSDAGEQALNEVIAHEKQCAIRYEAIEKRLESGSKRFDRLESMIWGVYVTVIVAVALPPVIN